MGNVRWRLARVPAPARDAVAKLSENSIMAECPFVNLIDPDTYVHGMPYDELARIRHQGPLVKIEDPVYKVPYWAVTRQRELDFICKRPKLFSSEAQGPFPMESTPEELDLTRMMMISLDPPMHQKIRSIVRAAFTPRAINAKEDAFRAFARGVLDKVAPTGKCEFVRDVAAELPLMAILELLSVPYADRQQFYDWTNTMIFADDPDMAIEREDGQLAVACTMEYAMRMAAEHRTKPKDGLVASLVDGKIDGQPISEEMFARMFVLILVGGNESTRTVTSHGMRLLMESPDQLQYLVENPARIPGACEEMLRYNTAFIAMRRTAMRDIEIGGVQVKRGDKLLLHYHTINHDENVFGDDAMQFDVRRAERSPELYHQLRSFGIGQHFCIGSHLARLELRIIMEQVITRLRNPQLLAPVSYARSLFVNGIKEMQIRFDPETSAPTAP